MNSAMVILQYRYLHCYCRVAERIKTSPVFELENDTQYCTQYTVTQCSKNIDHICQMNSIHNPLHVQSNYILFATTFKNSIILTESTKSKDIKFSLSNGPIINLKDNLTLSWNNLSGITSHFATQSSQVATQKQNCVAVFYIITWGCQITLP